MRPILFELFGISFPSYGVFVALGSLAAFFWVYMEGKRLGLDPEKALDVAFWILIGAIIGSRVLHVIVDWDFFTRYPAEAFRIWNGGLVLYGGFFGVLIASAIAIKVKKMPPGKTLDAIAPATVLGAMIGRMGCLLNGCCYGRPSYASWAISHNTENSAAYLIKGIPVHPASIYSMIMLAVIFAMLTVLARRRHFDGQIMWASTVLYPLGRFIVELYRGEERGYIVEPYLSKAFAFLLQNQTYSDPGHGGFYRMPLLSTSQFIGILVLAVTVTGYILASRSANKKTAEVPL